MANLQNFIQTVSRMQWSDYLDILVVAFVIYSLLPLLRTHADGFWRMRKHP